jgi:uncharacterized protein YaaN involved in tellurite resistance
MMSTDTRTAAANALAEAEKITANILPAPSTALITLDAAPAKEAGEIRKRMDEIDMGNTQSIISFGSRAQAELQAISQEMLAGVKNKDVGPAGDSLRSTAGSISIDSSDGNVVGLGAFGGLRLQQPLGLHECVVRLG